MTNVLACIALMPLICCARAGCPFSVRPAKHCTESDDTAPVPAPSELLVELVDSYPSEVLKCPVEPAIRTQSLTGAEYEAASASVVALYNQRLSSDQKRDFAGCILRYVGHDLMDYRLGQAIGGVDACINLADTDNRGLSDCLTGTLGLQAAYMRHCSTVSLADFGVIAAEALMGELASNPAATKVMFKQRFRYGRKTVARCPSGEALMPDPEDGCKANRNVFLDNVFRSWSFPDDPAGNVPFRWRLTAAIMGAHTLGSGQVENSGYDGSWSDANNTGKFNNGYYVSMLSKGWGVEQAVNGNPRRNQWVLTDSGDEGQHKQMMLDTDACLLWKRNVAQELCYLGMGLEMGGEYKAEACQPQKDGGTGCDAACAHLADKGVDLHARDGDCCNWAYLGTAHGLSTPEQWGKPASFCGQNQPQASPHPHRNQQCCARTDAAEITIPGTNRLTIENINCENPSKASGPAASAVMEFGRSEESWLQAYLQAWASATENNHPNLVPLSTEAVYLGCFKDAADSPDLVQIISGRHSSASCEAECHGRGFHYFGRQAAHKCFCGNNYGRLGPAEGCRCDDQRDVGSNVNCVYLVGATPSLQALPQEPQAALPPVAASSLVTQKMGSSTGKTKGKKGKRPAAHATTAPGTVTTPAAPNKAAPIIPPKAGKGKGKQGKGKKGKGTKGKGKKGKGKKGKGKKGKGKKGKGKQKSSKPPEKPAVPKPPAPKPPPPKPASTLPASSTSTAAIPSQPKSSVKPAPAHPPPPPAAYESYLRSSKKYAANHGSTASSTNAKSMARPLLHVGSADEVVAESST